MIKKHRYSNTDGMRNELKYITWNRNGLAKWKIGHSEFINNLENDNFISITESWMNEDEC